MRPLRTKPTFTPPPTRSLRFLKIPLIISTIAGLLIVAGLFYQIHAMPNVQLASADVGNKTLTELEAVAKAQFKKIEFRFISPSKTVTASASDLGITLNAHRTAKQAYQLRRNFLDGLQMWRPLDSPLVLQYDEKSITSFLAEAFGSEFQMPVNASLRFDQELNEFRVVEGKLGRGFNVAEIMHELQQQAWRPGPLTLNYRSIIEPPHTAVTVAKTGDEANAIIRLRCSFLYKDKVMYVAEPHEIATWLQFADTSEPGRLAIQYNRQAIKAFLTQKVTQSLNNFYGPEGGIPATDPTVQPALTPLELQSIDDLTNDIIESAQKKTNIEKELKVRET